MVNEITIFPPFGRYKRFTKTVFTNKAGDLLGSDMIGKPGLVSRYVVDNTKPQAERLITYIIKSGNVDYYVPFDCIRVMKKYEYSNFFK